MKKLGVFISLVTFILISLNFVYAWTPPIGIPTPQFGIEESYRMYDNPANRASGLTYTQNSEGGYYTHYVKSGTGCSDSGSGTSTSPRCTIPETIPAGSVVEVHGIYSYVGEEEIEVNGNVNKPVFIRGIESSKPRIRSEWYIRGSYAIFENLIFEDDPTSSSEWRLGLLGPSGNYAADHLAFRHSDLSGHESGGGTGAGTWTSASHSYIVFYNNTIHDNGDWQIDWDQDAHGLGVGPRASYIWIVDNEFYHNSGDGVQINGDSTTHHIYVGRNIAHHNKQTGFWTKTAYDVVFSENTVYSHVESGSSEGAGLGFQYDPERVWFLFNEIYNCSGGIQVGGSNVGGNVNSYYIGNLIHDLSCDDCDPLNSHHPAAITIRQGTNRYIIGNTIYNVHQGINIPSGSVYAVNNIISGITVSQGSHFYSYYGFSGGAFDNNLFYQNGQAIRIRWNGDLLDLAQFKSTYNKCLNCIKDNPKFVSSNPITKEDFKLQSTSPAIDKGSATIIEQIAQDYYTRYGVDIKKDLDRVTRPQGSGWDIGAYEYVSGSQINYGDIDSNNKVNIIDLFYVAVNYGKVIGIGCEVGSYCEKAAKQGGNLNLVDLADLSVVASNFGKSY